MADCPHLTRTSMYFDGALPDAEHAAALDHLETCAACQEHLRSMSVIDAVMSQAPVPLARPRRWPLAVATVAVAAAAAGLLLWFSLGRDRGGHAPGDEVAIVLPRERAIEARFGGASFSAHRPLGQLRGDRAREAIPLATLAELERRPDPRDLVAALAATGDLARAREVAGQRALSDADRAALELAAGNDEGALGFAYRALDRQPDDAAARWNFGLAARALGLAHLGREAFAAVVARGEPGWADEARVQVAALDREIDRLGAGFTAFTTRGAAMVQGGAPLTLEDVRRFPTYARVYLLDALRANIAADVVRPLAGELDRLSGTAFMIAAVDRASRADAAMRASFAAPYRAVVEHRATPEEITALLAKLRAAGPAMDDVRVGVIILGNLAGARIDELAAAVAPWRDPWFELYVARERIVARFGLEDTRAEAPLVAALAGCQNDAWALRCGRLAYDLAERYVAWGRDQEAEHWAEIAVKRHLVGGTPYLPLARSLLGEIHRHLGRTALARAELDEVVRADPSCDDRRFARIGLANVALVEDRWDMLRASLPPARPEDGCHEAPELLGLATAVELARHTRAAADIARAQEWIEANRSIADGGAALVAALRIAPDPAVATGPVTRWSATRGAAPDPIGEAVRTWATTTLVSDAGARGDWPGVIAAALGERADPAGCLVVASFDDGVLTIAARAAGAPIGEQRTIPQRSLAEATLVPAAIASSLRSCAAISVIARPPLHGRSDVLPADLPWSFAGDAPPRAAPTGRASSLDVSDARPPDPSLPRLSPAPSAAAFDVTLVAEQATPRRVLGALGEATYAELHVHGVASAASDDAAYLALSPDQDGAFALRADAVKEAKLRRAPVVVLAACRAATVAPYLRKRWSLPDAFLAGGASAVVAADVAVPDASARAVFDELHRSLGAGEPIEAAVAAIRRAATGDAAWAAHLMVFR